MLPMAMTPQTSQLGLSGRSRRGTVVARMLGRALSGRLINRNAANSGAC